MKGTNATYFGNILEGISSSWTGMKLTLKHLWQARFQRTPIGIADDNYFTQNTGIVTLQYPYESIPVPDNGRYRLYNEIEDCIVCDLCAKICPVNCIEIEPVKATEEIGKTSDGTTKRIYAATFDIDMAKCCYCGLCTTICPTECLTMTKSYDYSEYDVRNMIYHFTDLSPDEVETKKEQLQEAQKAAKVKAALPKEQNHEMKEEIPAPEKKPSFKPVVKVSPPPATDVGISTKETTDINPSLEKKPAVKPVFKPVIAKPAVKKSDQAEQKDTVGENRIPASDKEHDQVDHVSEKKEATLKPAPFKPVIKPIVKPVIPKKQPEEKDNKNSAAENILPAADGKSDQVVEDQASEKKEAVPKPASYKPVIKPIIPEKSADDEPEKKDS